MSGPLFLRTRSRDEDSCETKRIAVFSLSFFSSTLSRRKKNDSWVPRSRASAHRAFQTRRRWRASATFRLRARRRLTDFCNTNRRTGTASSCSSSPLPPGPRPRPPRSWSPAAFRRRTIKREKRASRPRAMGVTPPTATLRQRRDAKAERLRAKAASAFVRTRSPPRLQLVHPLS
jgi:hypothetical protein